MHPLPDPRSRSVSWGAGHSVMLAAHLLLRALSGHGIVLGAFPLLVLRALGG